MKTGISDGHWEEDEEGRRQWHSGYVTKKCIKCGSEFIVSKIMADKVATCGKADCERNKGV